MWYAKGRFLNLKGVWLVCWLYIYMNIMFASFFTKIIHIVANSPPQDGTRHPNFSQFLVYFHAVNPTICRQWVSLDNYSFSKFKITHLTINKSPTGEFVTGWQLCMFMYFTVLYRSFIWFNKLFRKALCLIVYNIRSNILPQTRTCVYQSNDSNIWRSLSHLIEIGKPPTLDYNLFNACLKCYKSGVLLSNILSSIVVQIHRFNYWWKANGQLKEKQCYCGHWSAMDPCKCISNCCFLVWGSINISNSVYYVFNIIKSARTTSAIYPTLESSSICTGSICSTKNRLRTADIQ